MKTGRSLQELAAEIERQHETKRDFIAPTDKVEVMLHDNALAVGIKGETFPVGDIAHGQFSAHTKIPKPYYDRMRNEAPALLANNVEHWFKKYPSTNLFRTLDGRNRSLHSDKFCPLDNYDFAEAILPVLLQRKLTIMSCEVTEKRLYIKAVDEQLFRDIPVGHKWGDGTHTIFSTCAPAIECGNSEVGYGRLYVAHGVYEKACTNLAMFSNSGFKRTHVGVRNKLADGIDAEELERIMSNATKRKTTEAMWLQIRDIVSSAFDEKLVRERGERIEHAAKQVITKPIDEVMELTSERFGFNDDERSSVLKHLVSGGSLTQWGLQQAITRASQDVASYDRATELEFAGGEIVELNKAEWATLAEAA